LVPTGLQFFLIQTTNCPPELYGFLRMACNRETVQFMRRHQRPDDKVNAANTGDTGRIMGPDTKETWDFFVCHILQDREIARTLADALNAKGLKVWYADYSLKVGDPLTALLDFGLSRSRMGIVIVSPQFLQQRWPPEELNGLASREVDGKKVILPVWHKVSFRDVFEHSPVLADTVAISTNKGFDYAMQRIVEAAK
jgi:TIR domain-containing protein